MLDNSTICKISSLRLFDVQLNVGLNPTTPLCCRVPAFRSDPHMLIVTLLILSHLIVHYFTGRQRFTSSPTKWKWWIYLRYPLGFLPGSCSCFTVRVVSPAALGIGAF